MTYELKQFVGKLKMYSYGNRLCLSVFIALFICIHVNASCTPDEPLAIFKAGDNGYACFRIPAIVKTEKGILLAFSEARKNGCSDTGDIDLVMRRSSDKGKTWEPIKVIWDAENNVAGNPAPVVDRNTGVIWLLSTWNLGTDQEHQIIDNASKDTRRIFVLHSNDEGRTWSKPRDITTDVKNPSWTWYATGPVHGIQMKNKSYRDRLLIPCDHIESGTKKYFSHVIYSDDNGRNWKLGGTTPQDQVNECTIAELPDGRLILNMRNYDRNQKNRKISISDDGGDSWSDIFDDPDLIEPICQASLLNVPMKNKKEILVFLNPSDSLARRNLVLKSTHNNGESWEEIKTLHAGPAAYSDLVHINKQDIGCLYEAGIKNPYEAIWFHSVKIK